MFIGKNKFDFLAITTGVLLFFAMQPFFLWGLSEHMEMLILCAPVSIMIVKNDIRNNKIAFILFLLILLFNNFIHSYNFIYAFYLSLIVFVPFCQKKFSEGTFDVFRKFLAICLVISLIEWILLIFGFSLPSYPLKPLNQLKEYWYLAYPPLLVKADILLEYRFYGPFDEPGVVGTICFLILYIENYNLKDIFNVVFFIAGLFSLSFFFIAGSLLYLLFKYSIHKIHYLLLFSIILMFFYSATKDDPILNELVYSRFEFDASTGKFAGDNRSTTSLDNYYNSIKGTQGYFFGVSENHYSDFFGASSYKTAVLRYGMFFCFLYSLFFVLLAISKKLSLFDLFVFFLMFFSTIYQRPRFYDVVFVFLFSHYIVSHSKIHIHKRNSILIK